MKKIPLLILISFSFIFLGCSRPLTVVKVIDGDTLILSDSRHVRLIGVDTPELHHPRKPVQYFAEEARQFTSSQCLGKSVRLEYDFVNKVRKDLDKYRRTLAYVYLKDGRLLNAEIIKQGYGFCYTRFPFEKMDDFRMYEKEAKEAGRGLWK